ncbi:hypothetical protein GUJ93_ZPchr0008g13875 [Zizania palustris]|uniref:Uncharacterized protein n=1 Tax=Zizania palustris TaxID=103762 RepID=A0A8J5RX40_ZIZPA|nr:hypothetical protein GUJ93_ZPchr0008g13875 [Zizania palustris]
MGDSARHGGVEVTGLQGGDKMREGGLSEARGCGSHGAPRGKTGYVRGDSARRYPTRSSPKCNTPNPSRRSCFVIPLAFVEDVVDRLMLTKEAEHLGFVAVVATLCGGLDGVGEPSGAGLRARRAGGNERPG